MVKPSGGQGSALDLAGELTVLTQTPCCLLPLPKNSLPVLGVEPEPLGPRNSALQASIHAPPVLKSWIGTWLSEKASIIILRADELQPAGIETCHHFFSTILVLGKLVL